MNASVIITVYNDTRWLEMILTALSMQSTDKFEVIIADDGSGEKMRTLIDNARNKFSFPIKHVWHEDLGWRKNIILNSAIKASESEYLIFLDGDCVPHHKFIEEHLRWREARRILAGRRVQLTTKLSEEISAEKIAKGWLRRQTWRLLWAGIRGEERFAENVVRISTPWLRRFIKDKDRGLLGCNFSLWRKDIMDVNGFDERYLHCAIGEDTDLELRMRNAGIRVLTKKHQLTVYHKKHKQQDFNSPENEIVYNENQALKRSYTPYGINREQTVDQTMTYSI